jgi:hypothetical protein
VNRWSSIGLNVGDLSRPLLRDDLRTNHGGTIVAAASDIRVAVLPIDSPSSFEVLCLHVSSGPVSEILVVVYRPGSQRVQQQFFMKCHRFSNVQAPSYLVILNIRL